MPRYLSSEWFRRAEAHAEPSADPFADAAADSPALVVRQVVRDTPEGEVSYDVVVAGGRARIRRQVRGEATLTLTGDYATACAVASGRLSAQAALAEGRLRVGGDLRALADKAAEVAGLDPVPADLRDETEF